MSDGDETYPLFVGATRPATLLGVSYTGCMLNVIIGIVAFLATKSFLPLLAVVPIHALMWLISLYEPRQFDLLRHWGQTTAGATSKWYWKGSTYKP